MKSIKAILYTEKRLKILLIFTKDTLTKIQDKMWVACIKSYNKIYNNDMKLKDKQKGRNFDINVKKMDSYQKFASNYEKHISEMSIIDRLKLGISIFSSSYINARIVEYSKENQNKVAMYLVNSV